MYRNHCHIQGRVETASTKKGAGKPRKVGRAPRAADSLAQDGILPGDWVAECAQDREAGSLLHDCGMLGTEADFSLTAAEMGAMDWLEEADEAQEEQETSAPEPPRGLVPPVCNFEVIAEHFQNSTASSDSELLDFGDGS